MRNSALLSCRTIVRATVIAALIIPAATAIAQVDTRLQPKGTSVASSSVAIGEQPKSSTGERELSDLESWIAKTLPTLGNNDVILSGDGRGRTKNAHRIDRANLSDCTISIQMTLQLSDLDHPSLPSPDPIVHVITATLKDVDIGKLTPAEDDVPSGWTASNPSYTVVLKALPDRATPFTSEVRGGLQKPPHHVNSVGIQAFDMETAAVVAKTIRDAAQLCGAPPNLAEPSPSLTIDSSSASKTNATKSETSSKMTNTDVLEMTRAGLSADVIATAVRQSFEQAFDVSPASLIALKKANVPDVAIAAMQARTAKGVSASSNGADTGADHAKTRVKYDSGLANPPAPAPTSDKPDTCTGVESLGLYQNQIYARAMGGGLVEWLAKIRNNNSTTKIVTFGWIDSNGQNQQA